jgi:hypothetical protein
MRSDVLPPIDDLAIEPFLNGDVRHGGPIFTNLRIVAT